MKKHFIQFFKRLDNFIESRKKILNFLVFLFDNGSKLTSIILFSPFVYFTFMVLFFMIPVYYSIELMEFLISIKSISSIYLEFSKLPVVLQFLFVFYFLLMELVFFCTLLASFPCIKTMLIAKYNDDLIIKKRGYNMLRSSARRATTLGLPIAASVLAASDYASHSVSVKAILESNQKILELYAKTKDKKLLDSLQKIPTGGFTQKIHQVGAGFKEAVVSWTFGSKSKD